MTAPDYDTVIVGAGFSGIGTAIELDRSRLHDYLVIEATSPPMRSPGRPAKA
jgi:cation diffusion facilitator CzcD-associated flavoprotein CzcO